MSNQQSTRIEIESFEDGNDFSETLTRAKFEELNMDLFRKTMKPVEQVLKDAGVKKEDVDEVSSYLCFVLFVLNVVLGRARWWIDSYSKVQQLLKEYFGGKEPSRVSTPMRLLPTVLPSRVVFSLVRKEPLMSSSSMFARSLSVSKPLAVSSPS